MAVFYGKERSYDKYDVMKETGCSEKSAILRISEARTGKRTEEEMLRPVSNQNQGTRDLLPPDRRAALLEMFREETKWMRAHDKYYPPLF